MSKPKQSANKDLTIDSTLFASMGEARGSESKGVIP